ncbi:MAG: AIPR family protein, partial [Kiritimatiellia bacterium]
NEVSTSAVAGNNFLQRSFFEKFCKDLDESGEIIEIPEYAYYKDPRGRAINGFYLDETESGNGSLNLFISIYSGANKISNINKDEIEASFKRLENFFIKSLDEKFYKGMEESSEGYNAAFFIFSRRETISNVNLFLLTDKKLSSRLDSIRQKQNGSVKLNYHLWDLTRLYRMISSERVPQDITINFKQEFGDGLACLPASFDAVEYKAYLAVIPGIVLAKLYEKFGSRLLERNVRSFLQAKGKVNKGIRTTILNRPAKFFAFNNGITATAEDMVFTNGKIQSLKNLQIVNGGQTTASLFSAYWKDKADISKVFVQMKLSVVSQELADEMVPDISKYANSQNKVNDADFFATHPFHKRIEDFSRRIYAPALEGQITQSKWFYERARGQYINGYAYKTSASKKKFQIEYPKNQLFTKTDLAKFEGVWLQLPHIVSKGAQYIFLDYAEKVEARWKKDDTQFNEAYYKIAIAKAIVFKATERIITNSSWYDGGYRANIVAYALAYIAKNVGDMGKSVNFMKIWNKQRLSRSFENALRQITKKVQDKLINNGFMSNIGQYCKRPDTWAEVKKIDMKFTKDFIDELVEVSTVVHEVRSTKAEKTTNT